MLLFPEKKDYPKDFYYHRTSSPTYREYLHSCGLSLFDIPGGPQFFWRKKLFGDSFGIVKWERTDVEPDIELIQKVTGLKHAFVAWIPYSRTKAQIPKPWRRLWLTDHFEETGYSSLRKELSRSDGGLVGKNSETPIPLSQSDIPLSQGGIKPHLSSWNDRAKRALKKFEKAGCSVKAVSAEVFIEAFRTTRVKHWHKSVYVGYYKKMAAIHPDKVRQWLAYDPSGKAIGGLAVHDYLGDHSVHLVAFTDQRAYDLQPGTGLMGEWFRESYERGYRYLTVDHLQNRGGPKDQKGYTDFKLNFITTRLSFREAYFRFF